MKRRIGWHNVDWLWWGAILMGVLGCADFVTPTGQYAMTHPWNTKAPILRGTSKAEVLEKWGRPDSVVPLGADELGLPKEEWIYQAKADVPIDYRYLSKTKRLLFTGDYVTGWKDEAAVEEPTHKSVGRLKPSS